MLRCYKNIKNTSFRDTTFCHLPRHTDYKINTVFSRTWHSGHPLLSLEKWSDDMLISTCHFNHYQCTKILWFLKIKITSFYQRSLSGKVLSLSYGMNWIDKMLSVKIMSTKSCIQVSNSQFNIIAIHLFQIFVKFHALMFLYRTIIQAYIGSIII